MNRAQELVARIEAIIAAMEPTTREVFLLHRLEAWPYARIAHVLGMDPTEVEQHIATAIFAIDRGLRSHDS